MTEKFSRNLIYIVTFLGTFFILLILLDTAFLYGGKSYQNYSYPETWDLSEIAFTKDGNFTKSYSGYTLYEFPDQGNFKFEIHWQSVLNHITVRHRTWEFLSLSDADFMEIQEKNRAYLWPQDLIDDYDPLLNATYYSPVLCDHISVKVWFYDHNQTRNNMTLSVAEEKIGATIGFGVDDVRAKTSSWDIIGRLLLLQAVEIGPWYIQALINIPIYVSIGYLVYRLILLAIPFVG